MTDLDPMPPAAPDKPTPGMFRLTVRIDFDDGTSVAQSTDLTESILDPRSGLFDPAVPAAHASRFTQNVVGQAVLNIGDA